LKVLAAGSFNLVRPTCNPKGLAKLEHLSFGGGFANKGLQLLFPLLKLKSLYVQVCVHVRVQTHHAWLETSSAVVQAGSLQRLLLPCWASQSSRPSGGALHQGACIHANICRATWTTWTSVAEHLPCRFARLSMSLCCRALTLSRTAS
jgi:hypothetical protein